MKERTIALERFIAVRILRSVHDPKRNFLLPIFIIQEFQTSSQQNCPSSTVDMTSSFARVDITPGIFYNFFFL